MNYTKFFYIALSIQGYLLCGSEQLVDQREQVHVEVQAKKTKKVSIGIVMLGKHDTDLDRCAQRLQKDLEWSGQCSVLLTQKAELKHAKDLTRLFDDQVVVAIVLSKSGSAYTWRLYDVGFSQMIAGKKLENNSSLSVTMIAHTIADEIWPELFQQAGSFRSKIAYSKQIWRMKYGKEKPYKQIWVADFDGTNPQLFIDAPTVSFAPRWNNDPSCPLLFYSENTLSNVQLVMSNMFGKRRIVCSFDGLNMQPTFSDDGKKVVFCLSKDGSSQLYVSYIDTISKQRKFDRLTYNSGNNIAPCFVDKTHVAFVSDYKTHKPQIFMLDIKTKIVTQVTDGGYCACPSYSSVAQRLVYSKMIGGAMELFVYDLKTGLHRQLTASCKDPQYTGKPLAIIAGSKEEGTWSPCGNYIVFGLNQGSKSRIAQLHIPTNTVRYLTSEQDHCTYPDCSPIYQDFLGVLNR